MAKGINSSSLFNHGLKSIDVDLCVVGRFKIGRIYNEKQNGLDVDVGASIASTSEPIPEDIGPPSQVMLDDFLILLAVWCRSHHPPQGQCVSHE